MSLPLRTHTYLLTLRHCLYTHCTGVEVPQGKTAYLGPRERETVGSYWQVHCQTQPSR